MHVVRAIISQRYFPRTQNQRKKEQKSRDGWWTNSPRPRPRVPNKNKNRVSSFQWNFFLFYDQPYVIWVLCGFTYYFAQHCVTNMHFIGFVYYFVYCITYNAFMFQPPTTSKKRERIKMPKIWTFSIVWCVRSQFHWNKRWKEEKKKKREKSFVFCSGGNIEYFRVDRWFIHIWKSIKKNETNHICNNIHRVPRIQIPEQKRKTRGFYYFSTNVTAQTGWMRWKKIKMLKSK